MIMLKKYVYLAMKNETVSEHIYVKLPSINVFLNSQ